MEWVRSEERKPEILEDGESDIVLCKGTKGSNRGDEGYTKYELMRFIELDKHDLLDSKGNPIITGWSNRWWDTNPDLYQVEFWTYLD